jgi:hypothetical protein
MATTEDTYLDKLKSAIKTDTVSSKAKMAGTWFRSIVNRTRGKFSAATPEKILQQGGVKGGTETDETSSSSQTSASSILGKMYFYSYNPKHKETLPWYDTFPLVFPIQKYNDGFLGLNFHYLQPKDRAVLMDQLKMYANNTKMDETTRLQLTYNMLKGFTKIKRAKPTIHRYLSSKVKSKFVLVNADEWEIALFLPVERFKKASKKQVWAHSKGMY